MRKIIVDGFLGCDPEIKKTKNGQEYMTFRIANSEYLDEKPMWFRCTTFNQNDITRLRKYLKKGSGVIVDGSYSNKAFHNNKSNDNEVENNIICSSIDFMRGNKSTQGVQSTNQNNIHSANVQNVSQPTQPIHNYGQQTVTQPSQVNYSKNPDSIFDGDDLPF